MPDGLTQLNRCSPLVRGSRASDPVIWLVRCRICSVGRSSALTASCRTHSALSVFFIARLSIARSILFDLRGESLTRAEKLKDMRWPLETFNF